MCWECCQKCFKDFLTFILSCCCYFCNKRADKDPKDCKETTKLLVGKDHMNKDQSMNTEKDESKGKQSLFPAICVLDEKSTQPTKDFTDKLKEPLLRSGIELKLTKTLDGSDPVIVICNCSTRLEQDIQQAVSVVKDIPHNRIILVALYLRREDSLPRTELRTRLTDKKILKGIRATVDMGFDENNIYECEKNNSSIRTISEFVKSYKAFDMENIDETEQHQTKYNSL